MAYENLRVMPKLDPNKEYTIEELTDYVRNAVVGENVREALARSMEATNEIATWARDVAQGLIDGAFDAGELATMIESKLNQLEQDYAPKLTSIETEIEDARGNESSLGDRLNDFNLQLAERPTQEEVTSMLGKIADGTPLFSADTSGMTDTSRLYVNTTDGYVYTHNGTSWVSTGVLYQSTGIENGSITEEKLSTDVVKKTQSIELLGIDPPPSKMWEGRMWLISDTVPMLKEDFRGIDGSNLDPAYWDIFKGVRTGRNNAVASGSKIDIFNNSARIVLSATTQSSAGDFVDLKAHMKAFEVDWSSKRRVISWKQSILHASYSFVNVYGIAITNEVLSDGGNVIDAYTLRVSNSWDTTYLQGKNTSNVAILQQNYKHGKTNLDGLIPFRLEIDAGGTEIRLYQDNVLKLTATSPALGRTKGKLVLNMMTEKTTPVTGYIDDLEIW